MTWVYRYTRSPGQRITAEYECPVHGRFTAKVERGANGDPPATWPCEHPEPVSPGASIDMNNVWSRWPTGLMSQCYEDSLHVISAPGYCRVQRVTAARRGKDPERPLNCMDWQALAYDEKPPEEVMAAERKKDWESVRKIVKGALR